MRIRDDMAMMTTITNIRYMVLAILGVVIAWISLGGVIFAGGVDDGGSDDVGISVRLITHSECNQNLAIGGLASLMPEVYRSYVIDISPTGDWDSSNLGFHGHRLRSEISGVGWGERTLLSDIGEQQRYPFRFVQEGVPVAWKIKFFDDDDEHRHVKRSVGQIEFTLLPDISLVANGADRALRDCLWRKWGAPVDVQAILDEKDAEITRLGVLVSWGDVRVRRLEIARDAAIGERDRMAERLRARSEAYQARIDQLREANERLQRRIDALRQRLRGR